MKTTQRPHSSSHHDNPSMIKFQPRRYIFPQNYQTNTATKSPYPHKPQSSPHLQKTNPTPCHPSKPSTHSQPRHAKYSQTSPSAS
ncbi:hypothetical protein BDR22DRAFT_101697 [Usnea florida]